MPVRVSPTDRVRAKIDELFASDRELPEILEEVARLGAQLLMQAALEERFIPPPAVGDRMSHHEGIPGAETKAEFAERI